MVMISLKNEKFLIPTSHYSGPIVHWTFMNPTFISLLDQIYVWYYLSDLDQKRKRSIFLQSTNSYHASSLLFLSVWSDRESKDYFLQILHSYHASSEVKAPRSWFDTSLLIYSFAWIKGIFNLMWSVGSVSCFIHMSNLY